MRITRKQWSTEDDQAILDSLAAGLNNIQIGERLGRTQHAINGRVSQLRRRGANIEAIKAAARLQAAPARAAAQAPRQARRGAGRRDCLCCRRPFASEGPHNRLCPRCRTKSVSPFAPGPISRRNHDD